MQVGRWNHQSSNNSSQGAPSRPYSPRPAGPSHTGGPRRFNDRGPSRGGYSSRPSYGGRGGSRGGGARRGGFGTFGETEAEIAKFMNKTVVTTEVPVFVPEHKFSDFDINENLKKNIIAR